MKKYQRYFKLKSRVIKKFFRNFINTPILFSSTILIIGVVFYNSLALIVIGALLIILKRKTAIFFIILLLASSLYTSNYLSHINVEIEDRKNEQVELTGRIIEPPSFNGFSQQILLDSRELKSDVLINLPKYPKLKQGENIKVSGKLTVLEDNKKINKDYLYFLQSKKVYFELQNSNFTPYPPSTTENVFISIRSTLENISSANLSSQNDALFLGILIGNKEGISKELDEDLIKTGTSHIVSASGFNVVIIYIILSFFVFVLSIKTVRILSIIGVLSYLFLIGSYILPAQRAAIMLIFVIISQMFGRKVNIGIALNISILIILFQFPMYYKNISFQLSVFATIGLFILSKPINKYLSQRLKNKNISEIISSTLGATIATLPITLKSFGAVSLVSLITNLLILPFVPIIMILGLISIVFEVTNLNLIANVIFMLLDSVLNYFLSVITLFSSLSFSYTQNLSIIAVISILLILLIIYIDFKNTFNSK